MSGVGRIPSFEVSDPASEVDGLRQVTVHTLAPAGRTDLTLWVPDAPGPLPVVVLLHGIPGSHLSWVHGGGVHRTAARLLREGAIPPMVLAMPSDQPRPAAAGSEEVVEEVVAAVEAAVPQAKAEAGICLAGVSEGGLAALRLGARHPGRFRAVAAHSAVMHLSRHDEVTSAPLPGGGELGDLLATGVALPPLRFDCGLADPLLAANRRLHERLTAARVAHVYEEHPGGHDWDYWTEHAAQTLVFFGSVLGRPPVSREVEMLPDGRRISYYSGRPS